MSQIPQLVAYGLVSGVTYAVLAASFWLIYATTRTFHLAHALVYTVGGYAVVVACYYLGLPLIIGFVAAIVFSIVAGCLIEAGIYRPLRRRGTTVLGIFLASLGIATAGAAVIQLVFGGDVRQVAGFPNATLEFAGATLTRLQLVSTIAGIVTLAGVIVLLSRTRVGFAITAVRSNPEMAMCVGIPINRVSLTVFSLGSAMAGLCAFWETINFVAYPTMGLQPVMYGVIGVFLGGVSTIRGAALGGFVLGFLLVFSGLFLSQNLGVILVFAVLGVVVVFRPDGLLRGPVAG